MKVNGRRGLLAVLFLDLFSGPVQVPLVHVAKSSDGDLRRPHEDVQVVATLAAAADERNPNRLAGGDRLTPSGSDRRMECRPGGDSGGRRGQAPGVFDEVSPIQLIAHVVLLGSRVTRDP